MTDNELAEILANYLETIVPIFEDMKSEDQQKVIQIVKKLAEEDAKNFPMWILMHTLYEELLPKMREGSND